MEDEDDEDVKQVKKAVATLREFFDSVQIFCSAHGVDDNPTIHVSKGAGNWFARFGQIKDWCIIEDERTRLDTRKQLKDGDDDE